MYYNYIVKHIKPCEWHRASRSHDSPSRPLRPAAPVVNRLRRRAFQNSKLESCLAVFFHRLRSARFEKRWPWKKITKGWKSLNLAFCHDHWSASASRCRKAEVWLRFWSWILSRIWCLSWVESLKLKFGQDFEIEVCFVLSESSYLGQLYLWRCLISRFWNFWRKI